MRYKDYQDLIYDVIGPLELNRKSTFSGTLETEGEHNWRIVVLKKSDMAYVGSANVDPDKTWIVYMDPSSQADETLVALCFDNSGTYNADVLDNVSLCNHTFYADVDTLTARLESTYAKTTTQDFINPTWQQFNRTKPKLPWLYTEQEEGLKHIEKEDYFVFVFDGDTQGHFELNNVRTAPPAIGSVLDIPYRLNAIKVVGITFMDGSDYSVDIEVLPMSNPYWAIPNNPARNGLPSTGMTHDLFGDGSCVASGAFTHYNLSLQGGYNMEEYRDEREPWADWTRDIAIKGSIRRGYLTGDTGWRTYSENCTLTCTYPLPEYQGKLTISFDMLWYPQSSARQLISMAGVLDVYMQSNYLYIYIYDYGSRSGGGRATIATSTWMNITFSFDDDTKYVRVFIDGVSVLSYYLNKRIRRQRPATVKIPLVFGGQMYHTGYKNFYVRNFRYFVDKYIDTPEALQIYNDTQTLPAKAVYQIKNVKSGVKHPLTSIYTPKVTDVNTSLSMKSHFPGFSPLKGEDPPQLNLDSGTFPVDELYSTHTLSASEVDEAQTDFPLNILVNSSDSPHLFEKGPYTWKYWDIRHNGTQVQAEVVDFKTGERDHTLNPVTSIRFRIEGNYYGWDQYIGCRRIQFSDENGDVIPYDASWVCEATNFYNSSYAPYMAFDDSDVNNSISNAAWRSKSGTQNENGYARWLDLIVTFPTPVYISKFRIYNYHNSGSYAEYGMSYTWVHTVPTGKFVIGEDTPSNAQFLWSGYAGRHRNQNNTHDHLIMPEKQAFEARCIKFGLKYPFSGTSVGLRTIRFYYKGVRIPWDDSWIAEADSIYEEYLTASPYNPKYAFSSDAGGSSRWNAYMGAPNRETNAGLKVTFPEAIKIDEIRVVNYFDSNSYSDNGTARMDVIVVTKDKEATIPANFYRNGDADGSDIIFGHYIPSAGKHGYTLEYSIAHNWTGGWSEQDATFRRYQEAIITVRVPNISDTVDTVITISDSEIDQEAAGYIGLQGSDNAKLVYDSTYEATYHMQEDLNPMQRPYPKVIDSSSNELHSVGGAVRWFGNPGGMLFPISPSISQGANKIDIPTPLAFVSEDLSTLSEFSVSAFLSQIEAKTGSVFSLGNGAISLENISLSDWGVVVDGNLLNNSRTPIVLDQPQFLTVNKSGNSYSLLTGDTLAGSDTNNSSVRIDNSWKGMRAKSVRFNFSSNFGDVDAMGIRSIEFYYKGVLVPYNISWQFDATSTEAFYDSRFVFNTALSKVGASVANSWRSTSGNVTNQVLTVSFLSQEIFDEIVINNYHDTGADTDKGIDGVTIDIHSSLSFTTVWDDPLEGSQRIFDSALIEHPATDTEEDSVPDIDVTTRIAKSVRFNFSSNWGAQWLGIRNLSFYKDGVKVPWDDSWVVSVTSWYNNDSRFQPRFVFDNSPRDGRWNVNWQTNTDAIANQVLTVAFPSPIEFDEVSYDNFHEWADYVDRGVKGVSIDIHPTQSFTTVWGATLTGSQRIWEGEFTKHISDNCNCADTRFLGLSFGKSSIAATHDGYTFKGYLNKIIISNVVRSVGWNSLMKKTLSQDITTHSETYGATPSDYVRYGFSFNRMITYTIWTGSVWRHVTSKDPAVHGVVDDFTWYYREAGDVWTKSPENNKENAFSNAVNEVTNRMTKTVADALTLTDWNQPNGWTNGGHFDMIGSVYQSSTVTSHIKEMSIDHTKKVVVYEPIKLDGYNGVITSSFVEWMFTHPTNMTQERYDINKPFYEDNVKCYACVTGAGDWVEITNKDAIPGITIGMDTIGKILQFKFEYTKNVHYDLRMEPVLQWKITTI